MKQWTKKQKITLAVIVAVIVVAIGVLVGVSVNKETEDGKKKFTVTVISERDNYEETTKCESEEEFLGAFLRTYEACEWQDGDYGIYITGFSGMKEDIANEYWWSVSVDGESATAGADEIALKDGASYEFELKQGW